MRTEFVWCIKYGLATYICFFFFSSRRRHTRSLCDWSSDVCSSDLVSVPLGFIGCWLGTMLRRETKAVRTFDELYVRSETGLGAEAGTGLTLTGRRGRAAGAAAATTVIPHP